MMDSRKMKARGRRISGGSRPAEEDESLVMFGEMVRREKERNLSLLDPVSVEFERIQAAGGHNLYKIPSGKRDFLAAAAAAAAAAAEGEKNDYDWLKTPPATPLFPSLEMEANNNNIFDPSMMIVHKELPILRPLIKPSSRFSNKSEAARTVPRPSSPTSKSSTHSSSSSSKSTTPKARLPNSQPAAAAAAAAAAVKTTLKQELNLPLKPNTTVKNPTTTKIKPNSNMIPRSSYRGVAALKITGSDKAGATPLPNSTANAPTAKAFAPSTARGRKIEFRPDNNTKSTASTPSTAVRKEFVEVEKVRSGRRERGGEEKEQRAKSGAQGSESLGFGSLVVPKASLSMVLKNSKQLRYQINYAEQRWNMS